jgi:hypothetical protein
MVAYACTFPEADAATRCAYGVLMPNASSMRLVRRYLKPGQVAEIRERTVVQINAFEFLVFINGSLIESQLFYGDRLGSYRDELQACCAEFRDGGWIEDPTGPPRSHG